MPQPNLPVLGLTYLLSMNQAAPCQTRYEMTSVGVFPVGKASAQKLLSALQYATDSSRLGKTYAPIPKSSQKDSDLGSAYFHKVCYTGASQREAAGRADGINTFRYTQSTRAEDKATQGCDLSADASADWLGRLRSPRPATSPPESDKSKLRL